MNSQEKRQFVLNTVTNYLSKIIKILSAFFITRILVTQLATELYGFWSLLWMVFGYSLILDFGFGVSIQKVAAEFSVSKDIKDLNQNISTVFFTYSFFSLIIVLASFLGSFYLESIFNIDAKSFDLAKAKELFLYFGLWSALIFPTGIFRELLAGLGRIDIRNYILLAYNILNFVLILCMPYFNLGIDYLLHTSLALTLITNFIMFIASRLVVKGLLLRIRSFRFHLIKKITTFSMSAYVIMFSNIIILKTDQILIGAMAPIAAVGLYQIGSRIPFLMKMLTEQFQENLAPLTAKLFKGSREQDLQTLFKFSTRFVIFMAICSFTVFFVVTPDLLKIWLNQEGAELILTSQILLCSSFVLVVGKSVNANMLLMLKMHKTLARISCLEAVLNLVLSYILIKSYGIVGVAIGTLIPQFLAVVFFIIPKTYRYFGISQWRFYKHLIKTFLLSLPPAYVLYFLVKAYPINSLFGLILTSLLYGLSYLTFVGYFSLKPSERSKIASFLQKLLSGLSSKKPETSFVSK